MKMKIVFIHKDPRITSCIITQIIIYMYVAACRKKYIQLCLMYSVPGFPFLANGKLGRSICYLPMLPTTFLGVAWVGRNVERFVVRHVCIALLAPGLP